MVELFSIVTEQIAFKLLTFSPSCPHSKSGVHYFSLCFGFQSFLSLLEFHGCETLEVFLPLFQTLINSIRLAVLVTMETNFYM